MTNLPPIRFNQERANSIGYRMETDLQRLKMKQALARFSKKHGKVDNGSDAKVRD